ncbi:DNA mismatch repair ATPase msh1 [Phytophthora pseudosyringae]|uniref:DNA mismatch repair ATPase msh1 n=1 Tax=Phytophthora pseudosyringae TaxID=221518 RepID=A0A8T1V972_9STRA|nr:DNA mismatch repair ATPase msh1 [Phytophthora pseudosyringae]
MLRLIRGTTSSARFSTPACRVSFLRRRHVCNTSWLSSGAAPASNDAVSAENEATKATPMVAQYLARKNEYPDCMLLFQVGDFYEFFGDDARRAAHLLNLALTRKTKKAQVNALNEMCGFPVGSVDSFVEKLVMHHGVKVAICNQVESASSAKKRGYNALVDRQVVRIVTPGSLVEDTMLTPKENNYLASLFYDDDKWGLAWADLSTGEFVSTTSTSEKLGSAILRCSPKEMLLPSLPVECRTENSSAMEVDMPQDAVALLETVLPDTCMKTFRPSTSFVPRATGSNARQIRGTVRKTLDSAEQAAASAILDYVDFTHRGTSALVRAPLHVESSDHMIIDSSAWRGLELAKSLSGSKASSLLQAIDSTTTPGGSRLLAAHLASPLMNIELLDRRLDAVSYFYGQEQLLQRTRKQLAEVFDMERNLQRLSIGVGTPKDLKNVASTIDEAKRLVELVKSHERLRHSRLPDLPGKDALGLPALLDDCCNGLVATEQQRQNIAEAAAEIHAALKDDYASLNSKSGFVRAGYSPELDKWQAVLRYDPKSPERQELQAKYRELLGSTRLRVIFQAEKGYFLDLPHDENAKLLKTDRARQQLEELTLFQSLKNSVRYRSEELRQLNRELTEAAVEVERVESGIFASLRARVLLVRDELQSMAHALSQIDVVCSHAQVALDRNFARPLLDGSCELHIEDGRHAVVEAAHLRGSNSRGMRAFVPNSLHLAAAPVGSCWLLTGPNMGGKSTFLRQSAHLVILAQMGSFVPAKFARVGLVDKLFCRVGSADDLAADKSTFMVEMQETSTVLTQATSRSLVLMDEVGRGTAVNDGVAIAGAVLEALCAKQTRTLFATHFTALSALVGDTCNGELRPYRMEVLEHHVGGETKHLVFSHRVVEGLAAQSYGINTAALAGCPPSVITRATELLSELTLANESKTVARSTEAGSAQTRVKRALTVLNSLDSSKEGKVNGISRLDELRQILKGDTESDEEKK